MNKHLYIPLLSIGLAVLMAGIRADVSIVNMDKVPKIKPQHVIDSDVRGELSQEVKQRLNLNEPHDNYAMSASDRQPNEKYRQAHPFPEMARILTHPPQDFQTELPGVEYIEGYHLQWPNSANGSSENARHMLDWRWQVPPDLKPQRGNWSEPASTDRYAALALTPDKWLERNPTLCYFDAMSGLKWQVEVPLDTAIQEARPKLPQPLLYDTRETRWEAHDVKVSVTQDGSRVVVVCPRLDHDVVVMFLYDGRGTLLRTLLFPGCTSHSALSVGRSSGSTFPIKWSHNAIEQGRTTGGNRHTEFYLIDGNGNVLGQFADNNEQVLNSWPQVSIDGLYAHGEMNGRHLIYSLSSNSKSRNKEQRVNKLPTSTP